MGLFRAILEGVFGIDEKIAGKAITRLTAPLAADATAEMPVESTIGFGQQTEGVDDAKVLLGGELVTASGRTSSAPFKFTGLTRAVDATTAILHPTGTLVFDMAENSTALDLVRRGIRVDTALGADLDVIGRNLGLKKCRGLTDAQWRAIIKALAYLPKQTLDAFDQALLALHGAGNYEIDEDIVRDPFKVYVRVLVALATSLKGRWFLNGGERRLTTGLSEVTTLFAINHVVGVFLDTEMARRGYRTGMTDYFAGGGSFLGSTITLGASPGGIGTAVIVDYGAWKAHYLAPDENTRDDGDFYAYLSDPLATTRCLLDQIRRAGIQVVVEPRV